MPDGHRYNRRRLEDVFPTPGRGSLDPVPTPALPGAGGNLTVLVEGTTRDMDQPQGHRPCHRGYWCESPGGEGERERKDLPKSKEKT